MKSNFLVYQDLKQMIYRPQTSDVFSIQSAEQSQARTAGIMLLMHVCCVCFVQPVPDKRAVGILLSEIKLVVIKFVWRVF